MSISNFRRIQKQASVLGNISGGAAAAGRKLLGAARPLARPAALGALATGTAAAGYAGGRASGLGEGLDAAAPVNKPGAAPAPVGDAQPSGMEALWNNAKDWLGKPGLGGMGTRGMQLGVGVPAAALLAYFLMRRRRQD